MNNTLLHTPEGMRDRYSTELAAKEAVKAGIRDVIHSYGYRDIETPTIEFFDIFNKDRGSVISSDMFKLFDRDNNTLVLRPDITPAIARAVSKYYADEDMPIRLCYCGNTFVNSTTHQGRLKENTQIGAELIGDATSDADAEIIAMIIDCLKRAGLVEFQVEIGHSGFFTGMAQEAHLEDHEVAELKGLLESKNYFGIEEFLTHRNTPENARKLILKLSETYGNADAIGCIRDYTDNETILSSLDYLEKLTHILEFYDMERYVTFDLGILSHYKYYTGIIFQAYTYGTGDMIVTGGRYDKLIAQFGKDSASVGFGVNLDTLMMALSRQGIEVKTDIGATILLYEREFKKDAVEYATQLRTTGVRVQMMKKFHERSIDDYIALAHRSFIDRIIYIDENGKKESITV